MQLHYLVGVVVGVILSYIAYTVHTIFGCVGVIKIDHSNPDKDIYRLELKELDDLPKQKYIVLKVDNNADLSQK